MCEWGTDTPIRVIRRNHPDISDGWHEVYVDACIAEYIQRMNDLGIITVGCCCGHGKAEPVVLIEAESVALLEQHGYGYRPFEQRTDVVEHVIAVEVA